MIPNLIVKVKFSGNDKFKHDLFVFMIKWKCAS